MLVASSSYLLALCHKRLGSFSSCWILGKKKISGRDPHMLTSGPVIVAKARELATTVFGSPFQCHMIDVKEEQVPKAMR